MEMKKVVLMTLLVTMGFMATIVTSTADSAVNNKKMLDSDMLLNVYSSLGQCWGKGCAPWSPCQPGCTCMGVGGQLGACTGPIDLVSNKIITPTADSVVNNRKIITPTDNKKMLDSNMLLNVYSSLGQCWGKGCAPWSPCQSGCTCMGVGGQLGACTGPIDLVSNKIITPIANSVVDNPKINVATF